MTLSGKVVVITGGAGRLGTHFCASVAKAGGVAVVADVDSGAARRVAAEIVAGGGRAEAATLDITDVTTIDELIGDLVNRHGRIDAVVNNAYPKNSSWGKKLEDVTYADFSENVSMHLGGYFLVAQRFALYFRSAGGGNIINISSVYGVIPPRFELYADTVMGMPVEYAAIKSAIIHLTRYFAQYFKKAGVRCNALSLGGILDRQPEAFLARYSDCCGAKGMLEPADVVASLVFLLSDGSRSVTGQNLIVDDGFSL